MKTATPNNETKSDQHQDVNITVLFKKMQKDDKKEVLLFHDSSADTKFASELLLLTGKMTILTISSKSKEGDKQYEPIQAEFVNLQRDNKKTVLKFNVATEDEERVNALYPAAGTTVELLIQSQQMTIDEVDNEDED